MIHHFGTWNLDISLGPVELQERGHCWQECKRIQTIQEMSPTRQHHQVSCWCWVVVAVAVAVVVVAAAAVIFVVLPAICRPSSHSRLFSFFGFLHLSWHNIGSSMWVNQNHSPPGISLNWLEQVPCFVHFCQFLAWSFCWWKVDLFSFWWSGPLIVFLGRSPWPEKGRGWSFRLICQTNKFKWTIDVVYRCFWTRIKVLFKGIPLCHHLGWAQLSSL